MRVGLRGRIVHEVSVMGGEMLTNRPTAPPVRQPKQSQEESNVTAAMERDMVAARGSGAGGRSGRRSQVRRGVTSAGCVITLQRLHLRGFPLIAPQSPTLTQSILNPPPNLHDSSTQAQDGYVDDTFDAEFGKMSVEDSRMRPFNNSKAAAQQKAAAAKARRAVAGKSRAAVAAAAAATAAAAAAAAAESGSGGGAAAAAGDAGRAVVKSSSLKRGATVDEGGAAAAAAASNADNASNAGGDDDEGGEEEEERETLHRLCPVYASDVNSPLRHVRTRIYFTSESHIHSLLNTLRYCHIHPVWQHQQHGHGPTQMLIDPNWRVGGGSSSAPSGVGGSSPQAWSARPSSTGGQGQAGGAGPAIDNELAAVWGGGGSGGGAGEGSTTGSQSPSMVAPLIRCGLRRGGFRVGTATEATSGAA